MRTFGLKKTGSFFLAAIGLLGQTSAFAQYNFYLSGYPTGFTYISGPMYVSYLGNSISCTATFTVDISTTYSKIIAINFYSPTTPGQCASIYTNGLPWNINAINRSNSVGNVSISKLSITVPSLNNITCNDTLVATLAPGSGYLTFGQTVGACIMGTDPMLLSAPILNIAP